MLGIVGYGRSSNIVGVGRYSVLGSVGYGQCSNIVGCVLGSIGFGQTPNIVGWGLDGVCGIWSGSQYCGVGCVLGSCVGYDSQYIFT